MSVKFGLEVAEAIQRHFPDLSDPAQNAQAATMLAENLGGVLAFAYAFGGENGGNLILEAMTARIRDAATDIQRRAAARTQKETAQ